MPLLPEDALFTAGSPEPLGVGIPDGLACLVKDDHVPGVLPGAWAVPAAPSRRLLVFIAARCFDPDRCNCWVKRCFQVAGGYRSDRLLI